MAGDGNKTIPVINPATEEVVDQVASGGAKEIDAAVAAARQAFDGDWGRSSGVERAGYLRAIAAAIVAERATLARLEVLDNGKPLPEALWDIDDAAGCFEYYADLAETFDGREEPVALPDDRFTSHVEYMPVGVAGLIIPWNYPLLMAAWKVAPALAAGCTAILKPSELTPLSALALGRIVDRVGLPAGTLNIVTGHGHDAGAALSHHPDVDKLAFTGSVPTGSRIMSAAAQDIKNISLELGGKSPILVFDDADIEAAVEWIMFGIFWNQGQVCSATSRLIVQQRIAPRLIERLVAETQRIRIGGGLEDGVLLGPLISARHREKVLGYVEGAVHGGAMLLSGGRRPPSMNRGYFMEPTILSVPDCNREIWREEVFGPVLCIHRFDSEQEGICLANDNMFGLAAAILSEDEARCARVARAMRAGVVWINCSQPTFTQAPWGGVKKSGIGRELGLWGFQNYLEEKQVTSFKSSKPWGWYL